MYCKDLFNIVQKWRMHLENSLHLSNNTIVSYMHDFDQFINFLKNYLSCPVDIHVFKKIDLKSIRAWLAERHSKNYNIRSTVRSISSIKCFCNFLLDENLIEKHAFLLLKAPKMNKTLPRPLTHSQTHSLLSNLNTLQDKPWVAQRDYALYVLIYSVGLRISEALSLSWSSFCQKDFITIVGKGGKKRQVPILPFVYKEILKYKTIVPYHILSHEPIFVGVKGKTLHATSAAQQLRKYRRMLQLPESLTPHSLRHTCATHLMESCGNLRSIQELLGHKSLSTTQIYTDINKAKLMLNYSATHPRSGKVPEQSTDS